MRNPSRGEMTTRSRVAPWMVPGLIAYFAVRVATMTFMVIRALVDHLSLSAQLRQWDGRWFLLQAQNIPSHLPYVDGHVAQNPIAFFPFFPWLIRLSHLYLHLPLVVAGAVLASVSGAVALACVTYLAREIGGDLVARRTGILLALSPGAFVFSLIYSEGFFLSFSALALVALWRGTWRSAALWALLATATSPLGLCLSVPAAIVIVRQWRAGERPRAIVMMVAPPVAFLSYLLYLWRHTGQPQAWLLTERGGWHSYFTLRFSAHVMWVFLSNPVAPTLTQHLLFWCTVIAIALCVVLVRSGLPTEVISYGLASTVLSACSAPIGLRPRFLLCAYPLVIGVSTALPGRWWRPTWIVSALFLTAMTVEEFVSSAIFP